MTSSKSVVFCLAIAALAGSASAQDWLDAPRLLVGPGEDIRGSGDVDGDGDRDLLVVLRGANDALIGFRALLRTSAYGYAPGTTTNVTAQNGAGGDFLQGDLTGDGLPEVVLSLGFGTYEGLHLYRNLGGTFARPSTSP